MLYIGGVKPYGSLDCVCAGWCFESKEAADAYDPYKTYDNMTLDHVIDTLTNDLVQRGRVQRERVERLKQGRKQGIPNAAYDLGMLLIDEYIQLPKAKGSWISVNYCLLFKVLPQWTLLRSIENTFC